MKTCLSAIIAAACIAGSPGLAQSGAEFSAAAGIISPPFILTNDYLFQAVQTPSTNGGKAVYSFTVPAPRQYVIQAVVEAPDANANSLLVNIDAEPVGPEMKWEIPASPGFRTNLVADSNGKPRRFALSAGVHQLIIRGDEPNVKVSRLSVCAVPEAPTHLRVVSGGP